MCTLCCFITRNSSICLWLHSLSLLSRPVQNILVYLNTLGQTKQFPVHISEFVHISEKAINHSSTLSVDNFERILDAVRRHLESRSSAFQTLSKRGRFLVRMRLASRLNAFSFSFKRVWLLVRTRLDKERAIPCVWQENHCTYMYYHVGTPAINIYTNRNLRENFSEHYPSSSSLHVTRPQQHQQQQLERTRTYSGTCLSHHSHFN